MLETSLLALWGYLFGGIPTAYLLGKRLRGVDIRDVGSGNVGTMNAYKQLGRRIGIVVLAVDMGKGAAAVLVAMAFGLSDWELFAVAVAVTVGNNWSVYLRFGGGKGLAVIYGVTLAMVPLLAIAVLPVTAAAFAITRGVVWSFGATIIALNGLVIVTGESAAVIAACVALSWIVIVTHFARSMPEIRTAWAERSFRLFGRVE
jgi:glycerol-3-phosphate acyltransferase PlsY